MINTKMCLLIFCINKFRVSKSFIRKNYNKFETS